LKNVNTSSLMDKTGLTELKIDSLMHHKSPKELKLSYSIS